MSDLRLDATERDLRLHVAAIEWSTEEPFSIQTAEDLRSKDTWQDRVEPLRHQVENLVYFCRKAPAVMFADDVGLGKTISAGLVLSELRARNKVHRTLVVCMGKELRQQWVRELDQKFGLHSVAVRGSDDTIAEIIHGDSEIVVTSYDTAKLVPDTIKEAGFDLLILDEAHHLRNLETRTPSDRALTFFELIRERAFRYVVMLTATPLQNRIDDVFSLLKIAAAGHGAASPFGSIEEFRHHFAGDGKGRSLKPGTELTFRTILGKYTTRTSREDCSFPFPNRLVEVVPVRASHAEQELLDFVLHLSSDNLPVLARVNLMKLSVSSPDALLSSLKNSVAKGTLGAEVLEDAERLSAAIHEPAKLGGLTEILDSLREADPVNWRCVVFSESVPTRRFLIATLAARGYRVETVSTDSREKYDQDPPRVNVLVGGRTASEGLNLQAGNALVNYDFPWNPMLVEQRIGRIQRLGSRHANVSIFNLQIEGSYEEHIIGLLVQKLRLFDAAFGGIEAIIEHAGGGKEALFEDRVKEIAKACLEKQDVDAVKRAMEEDIEKARAYYASTKQYIDKTLGSVRDDTVFDRPVIQKRDADPSMPRRELIQALCPGTPSPTDRQIRVAMGARARDHCALIEQAIPTPPEPSVFEEWAAGEGLLVRSASPRRRFEGDVWVLGSAENEVDRVTRLIHVSGIQTEWAYLPDAHGSVIDLERTWPDLSDLLRAEVAAEPGVSTFMSFYRAQAEQAEPIRRVRLQPRVEFTVTAARGSCEADNESFVVNVTDARGETHAVLVALDANGRVQGPRRCRWTGKWVASSNLKRCVVTKAPVERSLLRNGKLAALEELEEHPPLHEAVAAHFLDRAGLPPGTTIEAWSAPDDRVLAARVRTTGRDVFIVWSRIAGDEVYSGAA